MWPLLGTRGSRARGLEPVCARQHAVTVPTLTSADPRLGAQQLVEGVELRVWRERPRHVERVSHREALLQRAVERHVCVTANLAAHERPVGFGEESLELGQVRLPGPRAVI